VDSEDARQFYEHEALRSGWSVRQLKRQIDSQLECDGLYKCHNWKWFVLNRSAKSTIYFR
jgi:predicted nuclease of restriction endonuclease-like (RecB) superfamily